MQSPGASQQWHEMSVGGGRPRGCSRADEGRLTEGAGEPSERPARQQQTLRVPFAVPLKCFNEVAIFKKESLWAAIWRIDY